MSPIQTYYRNVLRRENLVVNFIANLFLWVCSYPRLMLEVFIRKNFGQRYFRLSSVITLALILFLLPYMFNAPRWLLRLFKFSGGVNYGHSSGQVTWYLFIILFLIFSFLRRREITKISTGIIFGKFGLYSGDINKLFYKIRIKGQNDIRKIETIWEPLFFFSIGLLLILFKQKIGIVIFTASIMYSLSYFAAYRKGDDFIADENDKTVLQEEIFNCLVKNLPGEQCRGVRLYMDRPQSIEEAEKLAKLMVKTEETDEVFRFK